MTPRNEKPFSLDKAEIKNALLINYDNPLVIQGEVIGDHAVLPASWREDDDDEEEDSTGLPAGIHQNS